MTIFNQSDVGCKNINDIKTLNSYPCEYCAVLPIDIGLAKFREKTKIWHLIDGFDSLVFSVGDEFIKRCLKLHTRLLGG